MGYFYGNISYQIAWDVKMARMSDMSLRDRILEAAEECFATHGVVETTMDDLVHASGVPRATLYRHVGNKEQMIVAVALRHMDDVLDGIEAIMNRHDVLGDGLVRAVNYVIDVANQKELVGVQFAPAAGSARLVRLTEPTRDLIVERLIGFMGRVLKPFRDRGQVRADLLDAEAAAWLSVVLAGLVLAPDTIPPEYRDHMVRRMLLPAFAPSPSGD